jgi:hypothetical protein
MLMFLIIGISQGEKRLEFEQTAVCVRCGRYGRYEVYMTYMYFSLFFIPIFKWNKRYYVKTSCCHGVCEIDRELGERIRRGEATEIREGDLSFEDRGYAVNGYAVKRCGHCGYETEEDFQYCPKCGRAL